MRYVLIVLMVLGWGDPTSAQDEPPSAQRESLRGLPGVNVVIEPIKQDAQADGLTEDSVRTAAERILQSGEIRILDLSEWINTPSLPVLHIVILTMKNEEELYSYSLMVELKQNVTLLTEGNRTVGAQTWMMGAVGSVGSAKLRRVIASTLEPLVKEFANEFLAVNPRNAGVL